MKKLILTLLLALVVPGVQTSLFASLCDEVECGNSDNGEEKSDNGNDGDQKTPDVESQD
ncbi:hypothetical protein [Chlamydia pecorum]|uniref:hypothetical protein n=1 Tax=Chlamydia pecorum TaxID=85991 RepID=UPI0003D3FC3C|nr:hypothetical protein [Chlamydia pecorum]ETF38794.1 hypothetical protein CpecS_0402 [Chlamydia pecorum VR629]